MNKTADARDIQVSQTDEAAAGELARSCGLAPLTARVLVARGITTPAAAQAFLNPSLARDWLDPCDIPGLPAVADAVEAAIERGTRILVFGDFDVDGITATTISVRGLRALGADAVGLIPHRYDEGYALSEAAVKRGMSFEPGLVMTVDCGISCGEEVAALRAQGVDVVITDHHEPGEHVPQGVPVADPKLVSGHPSRELSGAGVALKLICLLGARRGKPDVWRTLTDLAALGTVADLMELTGENRALVADGIERMRNNPRTSVQALCAICSLAPADITTTKLSFSLIPRLNAAGRMGDATIGFDLLMSDDAARAEQLATQLEHVNDERRDAEAQLTRQVDEMLGERFADEPVIVVGGQGWHEGVKGIVASRIARTYKRPALVFCIDGAVARGSGRTYGGVNLFELARTAEDLYEQFGGHAAAIGITLPADKLEELAARLADGMRALGEQAKAPEGARVDAQATLSECTVETFRELERLEPFGSGNPVVRLCARGVFLERCSAVGKLGNHLRYVATDGLARVDGIFFGPDELERLLHCERACDIVFEASVDEWRARSNAKLMTRDIIVHEPAAGHEPSDVETLVADLFERGDEILDTGEYAGITQAARFNTKVVGVTFENRQAVVSTLEAGVELMLKRQPDNEMDEHAIGVHLLDGTQLGYLNRQLASRLAPVMDAGVRYDAAVTAVTGGERLGMREPGPLGVRDPGVVNRAFGVNIVVRRPDLERNEQADARLLELEREHTRATWAALDAGELDAALVRALIGEHELHDAQAHALAHLAAGRSTLCVMATGRGKSLIFHVHAARCALSAGKASLFVYPLRALVADQAFHLQTTFSRFGLNVCVLTGECDADERERIYADLAAGDVDIVLTTPEFLCLHAGKLAATGRIGFLVVDEAHHIGLAKAGNRPAYAELAHARAALHDPLVLAVTATAPDEQARLICESLAIREVVLDASVRENLHIDDRRDVRERENYLATIVGTGEKCVVYVNSREQSMDLTRALRRRLPELAPRIAFYNAGLSKADRKRIETAFRDGELVCIVSTSAFGEGIDIPDVRHVVLFHLPFSDIEFNQMSGRAGRDGKDSHVHLLYCYGDARINENILAAYAPSRKDMAAVYRVLMDESKQTARADAEGFSLSNSQIAERARRKSRGSRLDESGVSCALAVFRELGFVETWGRGVSRRILMVQCPQHMELSDSLRYREGEQEQESFAAFKAWALGAGAEELLARFNRPILPEHPDTLVTR